MALGGTPQGARLGKEREPPPTQVSGEGMGLGVSRVPTSAGCPSGQGSPLLPTSPTLLPAQRPFLPGEAAGRSPGHARAWLTACTSGCQHPRPDTHLCIHGWASIISGSLLTLTGWGSGPGNWGP